MQQILDPMRPSVHQWPHTDLYKKLKKKVRLITGIIFSDQTVFLVKTTSHCTCIHKAFDDTEDVVYLFLSNNVVDVHSNAIGLIS